MESFTTQDLIAELQEYSPRIGPRREGGVTTAEWSEAQGGISDVAAGRQLKKLVANGILEREWAVIDGRKWWVYYKKH